MKHLFIYAHIDDESILSYGTICKLIDNNEKVYVYCLCGKGSVDRNLENQDKRLNIFKNSRFSKDATIIYGNHIDLSLNKEIVKKSFNNVLNDIKPNYVYTHSIADNHFEHRLLGEVSLLLCRKNFSNDYLHGLFHSCSPTTLQTYDQYGKFVPNYFVDISKYSEGKQYMLG